MAGGDSSIPNNFKLPDVPSLTGATSQPIFDAAALQGSRSYTYSADAAFYNSSAPAFYNSALNFGPASDAPHMPMLSSAASDGTPALTSTDLAAITTPAAATGDGSVLAPNAESTIATAPPVDNTLQPGQTPSVTVRYSDQALDPNAAAVPPTVVIDKYGQLFDAAGKPFDMNSLDYSQTGVPKNFVIQLQHDASDPSQAATQAQTDTLNQFLANAVDPALRQQNEAASEKGITLQDTTGQVMADVVQDLARVDAPEPPPPAPAPQTEQAVNNINQQMPSDNQPHSMPARQANNYFSQADVPQGQAPNVTAQKDMLAALEGNKENPYETVQQRGDHSYAVGRYGNTFRQMNNYLMMALTPDILALLGHPPDYSKLGEILKHHPEMLKELRKNLHKLVKEGKIPEKLADRFKTADAADHFGKFVEKLQGGKGELTAAEIKQNLPKDLQESLASELVTNGIAHGATPGQIALANQLGKTPDQLTYKEINDPSNEKYMQAATKYYALASARPHAQADDQINYQISSDPHMSNIRMEIARAAGSHITGGSGYCARSAQEDLASADPRLHKFLGSGNAWAMGQYMKRTGDWVQIDPKDAQPGDAIFFHDPNYYGDVQLIKSRSGDNIKTANDHWNYDTVDALGNKSHRRNSYSSYDYSEVLRYVGDQKTQYASNQTPKTSDQG